MTSQNVLSVGVEKLLVLILTVCLQYVAACASPTRKDEPVKERRKYQYLLHVPKSYEGTKQSYPLVIYLHGSSQKGNDLQKLKGYGLPQMVEQGRDYDFLIASPQCPSNVSLWSSENWFEPLIEEIKNKYQVDPSRIYLTGVSMGGGGVFDLAKEYPHTFAALVPLCAWASSASDVCKIGSVPVWTFHGSEDYVVPISETQEKVRKLQACKGNIRFTVLQNEGHGIHWLYEKEADYGIFKWMLAQKR